MKKKALDFLNRSRVETPKVYQSARDAVDQNLKAIEEFELPPGLFRTRWRFNNRIRQLLQRRHRGCSDEPMTTRRMAQRCP